MNDTAATQAQVAAALRDMAEGLAPLAVVTAAVVVLAAIAAAR